VAQYGVGGQHGGEEVSGACQLSAQHAWYNYLSSSRFLCSTVFMAPSGPSVSFPLFPPCQHWISIQFSILQAPPTPSFDAPVPLLSAIAITHKLLPILMISPMPLPWQMLTHPVIFGAAITSLSLLSFGQCIHPRINRCPGCISEVFLAYISPIHSLPQLRVVLTPGFLHTPTPICVNLYP